MNIYCPDEGVKRVWFGENARHRAAAQNAKYIRRFAVDRNESDLDRGRAEEMPIIYSMEGIHSLKASVVKRGASLHKNQPQGY